MLTPSALWLEPGVVLSLELEHPTLRLGVVHARVRSQASDPVLQGLLDDAERRAAEGALVFPEQVRAAVRDVLRVGGYKPTGRGKPASELLLSLAQNRALPRIGNLVDSNNLSSLTSALPISIFDADALGPDPVVRFGRAGERYVFNASGHGMELAGLPVVCRRGGLEPVGNAVRDSMTCKVGSATVRVLAVVYGSDRTAEPLAAACEQLRELLVRHAAASDVELSVSPR